MTRDGWRLVEPGAPARRGASARVSYAYDPPETWAKPHPGRAAACELRLMTDGVHERDGAWYVRRAEIRGGDRRAVELGRVDWVDWDANGDLLLARDGRLLRVRAPARGRFDAAAPPETIVDLSPLVFEERPPPPEARAWTGPRPRGVPVERAGR